MPTNISIKAAVFPVIMYGCESWPIKKAKVKSQVLSNSLRPHRLKPTRLLCSWDSPGKNTGVGCHFLLQGIFPIQGSNLGLPHSRQTLYCLSHQGSPKKAKHHRIDAFELWCCRRLLRVPWTARRSNLSIQKEINPEHSLEGLMLKLKLQYLGHLMWKADCLEKTLMLGKMENRRKRGC